MNKQLEYSLIQAGYMILIAAITASLAYVGGTIDAHGFLVAVLVSVGPALQRVYKGWEDGIRNDEGQVIPSDVTPNPPGDIVVK